MAKKTDEPFDVDYSELEKPSVNIDPFDVDFSVLDTDDKGVPINKSLGKFGDAIMKLNEKIKRADETKKPSIREMLYTNPELAKKFETFMQEKHTKKEVKDFVEKLSKEDKKALKEYADKMGMKKAAEGERKKVNDKREWDKYLKEGSKLDVPEEIKDEKKGGEIMFEDLEPLFQDVLEPDVPEIDTKVVDLPEEDENEKEIIVEHNDTTSEPSDTTVEEPLPQEENTELENFDESEVVDPPEEENFVSAEEVEELEKEDKSDDKDITLVEGGWNMSNPKYRRALAEAQAMAQDDLDDFRVSEDWENWTPKQKADSIKAWRDAKDDKEPPKAEDHRQYTDESQTNNFEAYKRYPTGLRVAEDLAGAGEKVVEGAGDVAKTEIGGTGANMISERAKGVPHYDYTSLFGRR